MDEQTVEERPKTMSPDHIVWHRLKVLRDANRKVAEESDMLMQAIEAAPELDMAMQVSFGIQNQPANQQGPTAPAGYKGGAPR